MPEIIRANRPADETIKRSAQQIGRMDLIAHAQVKVWKAMLVGLFFAGFIAAVASSVSFKIGQKSEAAFPEGGGINLLKGSTITSSVFCETGECWENLSSGGSLMFRQFGVPEAIIEFPGILPYTLTKLVMDIDPSEHDTTMLPKSFRVETSQDCKIYQPLLSAVKDRTTPSQSFEFPSGTQGRCLKLFFESNYGHDRWTKVKGLKVMGY